MGAASMRTGRFSFSVAVTLTLLTTACDDAGGTTGTAGSPVRSASANANANAVVEEKSSDAGEREHYVLITEKVTENRGDAKVFPSVACLGERSRKPGRNPSLKDSPALPCTFYRSKPSQVPPKLEGMDLRGSSLDHANLRGRDFERVNADAIILKEADISNSVCIDTRFQGADLRGANGAGSHFQNCGLASADLRGAKFERAELRACDLRGARLQGSFWASASLRYLDLRDADLTDAVLLGADLRGSYFNSGTRLPFSDEEAQRRGMVKQP
jgi:hypothetical protein